MAFSTHPTPGALSLAWLVLFGLLLPTVATADVTPSCGGRDAAPCDYTQAVRVGRAKQLGCAGKAVYWSPLKGGCWTCPADHERTLYPLTGKKACRNRDDAYARANKTSSYWGCPEGQFHRLVKGYGHACYTCGEAYTRRVAALDSPKACKVRREYQCDGALVARSHVRNGKLVSRCGDAFDAQAQAAKVLKRRGELVNAATALLAELTRPGGVGKDLRAAIRAGDWAGAQSIVTGTGVFRSGFLPADFTLTVGLYGDLSLGVGTNGEIGVAITPGLKSGPLIRLPHPGLDLMGYKSVGVTNDGIPGDGRISLSADAGLAVGIWSVNAEGLLGSAFGLTYGVSVAAAPSVSVWWTDNGKDDWIGVQAALGPGLGLEWSELNHTETSRLFSDTE